jgi:hypothetical protein
MSFRRKAISFAMAASLTHVTSAAAQEPAAQHQHMTMDTPSWQLMQDGIVFAEFNHQGSPRGGDEFVVPNWWMGMATRDTARGRLTFTGMLSLEAATVGRSGYREIFQAGEALDGLPLIDRQHPHDFFMQLGAIWRIPLSESTGLTLAGAPVGEPALGPVAFMHRASAADNPTAPLGHHTFDSTHIAFGVVTAAIDRGRWTIEGSVFNGREPDDNRWDFDFAPLDSYSGRLWFRPTETWELQASIGHLTDPEELEPGDITRATASVGWTLRNNQDMSAMTVAFGRNDTDHGARNAFFIEGAKHAGLTGVYGRFEAVQTETALLDPTVPPDQRDVVVAMTGGVVRDVMKTRRFDGALGLDFTLHATPSSLVSTYGGHPVSFHVFFRLRPAGPMNPMWNMRMSQAMPSHRP